ncbi:MAG: chemotaxis protein CheW [Candidatus Zixiibacteriota bacterium]|nr:MAG: chemotaxis protein CheW [candidate division Zixibacteria bacterium]HHI03281.1 purine-binding chemotaxis protein CheW [candidate division Zixibacteria bacterium]
MTKTSELTIDSRSSESAVAKDRAGKYLTFRLDNEEYGLEILKVREIIGLMNITSVPKTPEYVRGIINLRGSVIPVLELKKKFDMGETENTEETCVIVVEVALDNKKVMMGIIVDAVSEVLDISEDEIEDAPAFGTHVNTRFILGIGKVRDEVKILLDIDEVLTAIDIAMLEELGKK